MHRWRPCHLGQRELPGCRAGPGRVWHRPMGRHRMGLPTGRQGLGHSTRRGSRSTQDFPLRMPRRPLQRRPERDGSTTGVPACEGLLGGCRPKSTQPYGCKIGCKGRIDHASLSSTSLAVGVVRPHRTTRFFSMRSLETFRLRNSARHLVRARFGACRICASQPFVESSVGLLHRSRAAVAGGRRPRMRFVPTLRPVVAKTSGSPSRSSPRRRRWTRPSRDGPPKVLRPGVQLHEQDAGDHAKHSRGVGSDDLSCVL